MTGCAIFLAPRSAGALLSRRLPAVLVVGCCLAAAARPLPARCAPAQEQADLDGSLDAYLAHALSSHPRLDAAAAAERAATLRAEAAGRLPDPTLGVGVFVQPVETRVGPQRARVSAQQRLPWGRSAQRAAARATANAVSAAARTEALEVALQVAVAWWDLWELRTTRAIHVAHLDVLDGLSQTLRARLEVGQATLADLQQIDLSRAILADRVASMRAAEAEAAAALGAAVGLPGGSPLPTTGPLPAVAVPAEDAAALAERAAAHPRLRSARAGVAVAEAQAHAARAARLPGLAVGADWIVTGPAPDAAGHSPPEDSGKDALVATVGLTVPLWQRAAARTVEAAEATRAARDATVAQHALDVQAAVLARASSVRDSARRVGVVEDQLLPQAEAAYASLLGSYTAGQAGVAQVLLAQQSVLERKIDAARARANHARAWAALTAACGSPVPRRPPTEAP